MKKIVLTAAFFGFGALAMAQQTPTPQQKAQWEAKKAEMMQKRGEMEKNRLAKMQQELNLTPNQVAQIQALNDREKAERQANWNKNTAARNAKMEEMKAKKAAHDAEMRKILTPEQYTKWEARKQEMMQKRKQHFREMPQGQMMQKAQ